MFSGMLSRQLFYDLTENGLINRRILQAPLEFTQQLNLTSQQKEYFFNGLVLQAKKLLAVWIHLDRFSREVERLQSEAPIYDQEDATAHVEICYSQELFLEFDEFLVQYKSSLDYLAKLPAVFFGRQKWNLRTFGDKGERVLKLLRNVLPQEKKHFAHDFEQKIFEAHRSDIRQAVEMRDRVNHYLEGGIPYENFRVFGLRQSGKVIYKTPMWNDDQTLTEFMNVAFHNHLKFCEDFIVFFLGFHLQPGFGFLHQPVPAGAATSPWKLIPTAMLPFFVENFAGLEKDRAVDEALENFRLRCADSEPRCHDLRGSS
jgi:hypothetical protein